MQVNLKLIPKHENACILNLIGSCIMFYTEESETFVVVGRVDSYRYDVLANEVHVSASVFDEYASLQDTLYTDHRFYSTPIHDPHSKVPVKTIRCLLLLDQSEKQ